MKIKVTNPTITAIQKLITGDRISNGKALAPYMSGQDLITFFNQFGSTDEYGPGFPSRWVYVEGKLAEYNGTPTLKKIIEAALDPRRFLGTEFVLDEVVEYLNQFLEYDGYNVTKQGKRVFLSKIGEDFVKFDHAILASNAPNIEFIKEQIYKCKNKILNGDHDGAITNARSLLEAVLLEIEAKILGRKSEYNGDLNKLYKRIQKLLNLEPSRIDISNSLKQILTGIISIVGGIASLRNKMSDSHVRTYKPAEHHAKLVVNSVQTICIFLLESFEYQVKSGFIKLNP